MVISKELDRQVVEQKGVSKHNRGAVAFHQVEPCPTGVPALRNRPEVMWPKDTSVGYRIGGPKGRIVDLRDRFVG